MTLTHTFGDFLRISFSWLGKHCKSAKLIAEEVAPVSMRICVHTLLILRNTIHLYFFPGKLWPAAATWGLPPAPKKACSSRQRLLPGTYHNLAGMPVQWLHLSIRNQCQCIQIVSVGWGRGGNLGSHLFHP